MANGLYLTRVGDGNGMSLTGKLRRRALIFHLSAGNSVARRFLFFLMKKLMSIMAFCLSCLPFALLAQTQPTAETINGFLGIA